MIFVNLSKLAKFFMLVRMNTRDKNIKALLHQHLGLSLSK